MCTGVQEAVLATIWSDARGRAAYLYSGGTHPTRLAGMRPCVCARVVTVSSLLERRVRYSYNAGCTHSRAYP